jgi:chromosome segregation ATPase
MIGSIAYLALIVLAFVESYREGKAKIEQTTQDMTRLDDQLSESEHARKEAEERASKLEEEALGFEQEITDLQYKIRASMPSPSDQGEN